MKFKTNRDTLLKAVALVQSVVNPKHTLPILSNILMETLEDKKLRLFGTDMDAGISLDLVVDVQEKGEVTIPAKKFYDILRELPNGEVNISVAKNNAVSISAGKAQFKLMGLPKEDFPTFPDFSSVQPITIDQALFKECLRLTSFAVSTDEMRYVLNGILVKLKGQKIQLVATDGRRLAFVEKKISTSVAEYEAIIPTKAVSELNRILGEGEKIQIYPLKNQIVFGLGNTFLFSRLIEGHFPNYDQVIPKEEKITATVGREDALAALRRAALLTSAESQAVKIDFLKNKTLFSSRSPNLGEAREEIESETKGGDVAIGLNPNYLIDALKNLQSDKISFSLTEPDRPGVLKGEEGYLYVIMPMQLI